MLGYEWVLNRYNNTTYMTNTSLGKSCWLCEGQKTSAIGNVSTPIRYYARAYDYNPESTWGDLTSCNVSLTVSSFNGP